MSSIDPSFGLIPLLPPGASVSPGGTRSEYGEHTSLVEGQDPQHRSRCREGQSGPGHGAAGARRTGRPQHTPLVRSEASSRQRHGLQPFPSSPHEADAQ